MVITLRSLLKTIWTHGKKHTGVGLVCSVAYFDPGNWGVDLQAGSLFGYRLLFVVLLSGLIAVFFQVLSHRLGCVSGLDLASHCRVMLYPRAVTRYSLLYPLYILAESAIIATDLAELLGSAIALCLLFPALEIWHGVLITAFDVLLILALGDPLGGRPARIFEIIIAILVIAVLICMCIIIARVHVDWPLAFLGYVPSKYILKDGALYTSVGIIGATVMPHSLFLGSALATQDRVSDPTESLDPMEKPESLNFKQRIRSAFRILPMSPPQTPTGNPLSFVKIHLYHGIVDVVLSLLGFAIVINSLILILSGATLPSANSASLFEAYDLIRSAVSPSAAILFAVALLFCGQSSSLIATVAGQAVSEGFLSIRLSPLFRRLLTRLMSLIPALTVAIAIGKPGINALLVASQVVLSIVLPFIVFPLLWLTSNKRVMSVQGEDGSFVCFGNSIFTTLLGAAVWLLIVIANVYVLVTLGMGTS
ncbi:putative transporter of the NRAMP family [Guyanagaster necrorhizus]|uniref:Transporter of the NRAMP family n=1 Tax=Guyanagaster necrorhizus TaxID=856835 RepID=A0A9P7VVP4_9AGAR|nr:putative transporter of the NRAMP family [Guyanagaster necrorhizus MCA 3950]KAG7447417.1 putative transporter of the NRAMP family [Guyanagaster necrorhizus MCA 3950]